MCYSNAFLKKHRDILFEGNFEDLGHVFAHWFSWGYFVTRSTTFLSSIVFVISRLYADVGWFFWCMQNKDQWSTDPVVFFNHLMLVLIKEHTYLNKPAILSRSFAYICITSCYHQMLKYKKIFWEFLWNNHAKSEGFHQLFSLKKLLWKFSGNSWKNIHNRVHIDSS